MTNRRTGQTCGKEEVLGVSDRSGRPDAGKAEMGTRWSTSSSRGTGDAPPRHSTHPPTTPSPPPTHPRGPDRTAAVHYTPPPIILSRATVHHSQPNPAMRAHNAARLAQRPSPASYRLTGKTGSSRPAHAVTASAAAFHSSPTMYDGSDADQPKSGIAAALASGQGNQASSSTPRRDQDEGDNDSALAFGGGASSRGGPSPAPSIADISHADIFIRPQPSPSAHPSSSKFTHSQSKMISGSAGKGAVPGYGKRRAGVPDGTRTTTRERDDEIVRGYEHTVGSLSHVPQTEL